MSRGEQRGVEGTGFSSLCMAQGRRAREVRQEQGGYGDEGC